MIENREVSVELAARDLGVVRLRRHEYEIGAEESEHGTEQTPQQGKQERIFTSDQNFLALGVEDIPFPAKKIVKVVLPHPSEQIALGREHRVRGDDDLYFMVLKHVKEQILFFLHYLIL